MAAEAAWKRMSERCFLVTFDQGGILMLEQKTVAGKVQHHRIHRQI